MDDFKGTEKPLEMSNTALSIDCARKLSQHLHCGQTDKQGRPYFEHIERVANACCDLSTDQQIAAYLHETLEDTNEDTGRFMDAYSIRSIFGDVVAGLVIYLTRLPHQTYHQYIVSIAEGNPLAIPIKLADLNDNLDESRGPIPESLRKRYLRACEYLISALNQRKQ